MTPLHVAARTGNTKVITFLMRAGASLTARTSNGYLPIDCSDNEEIKQLIRDEENRRRSQLSHSDKMRMKSRSRSSL